MEWWSWVALIVFLLFGPSVAGLLLWRRLAGLVQDVDEGRAFGGEYEE